MKWYQHNQTTPLYFGDVKLIMGDIYEEDDDGNVVVMRDGKVIYSNKPSKDSKKEKLLSDKDLKKLNKKELEKLAYDKFGVDLDRRKSKEHMIMEIKKLMR